MLKKEVMTVKLRSWKYFIDQGIRGMFKNGIMSFASIVIVSACIFIVILSLCIITNLNYALNQVESNIGIALFLGDSVSEEQVMELKSVIEDMDNVTSVSYSTREDAFEDAKQMWSAAMLDGIKEENPLPRSLEVKLDAITYQKDFINKMKQLQLDFEHELVLGEKVGLMQNTSLLPASAEDAPEVATADAARTAEQTVEEQTAEIGGDGYSFIGIEKISHADVLIDYFLSINTAVKIIGSALIIILCIISIGIIMNTIKLTVFVRRTEIGIMKYVGATDWFIRWPFVVEGVIIGLIGAVVPIVICWIAYGRFEAFYQNHWTIIANMAQLKTGFQIFSIVGPVSILVGALLGAVGSLTAIRNHLNV